MAKALNTEFLKNTCWIDENDFENCPAVYHYLLMLKHRHEHFKFILVLANFLKLPNNDKRMAETHPFHIAMDDLINSSKSKYITWIAHERKLLRYVGREDLYHQTADQLRQFSRSKRYMRDLYRLKDQYHDINHACQIESRGVRMNAYILIRMKVDDWNQKKIFQFSPII